MRVTLSQRRARFYEFLRAVLYLPTEMLVAALRGPRSLDTPEHRRRTRLYQLACLRVLAGRDESGRTYAVRKCLVRTRFGLDRPSCETSASPSRQPETACGARQFRRSCSIGAGDHP